MAKYKLVHDCPGCIGCGACVAVAPDYWEMGSDGKSALKGSKKVGENEEREIEEKDFTPNDEAAKACPVNVIHITDLDKKKQLI
ncbi:MAG: ferredoxin [Candidatus Woesearchaeota archaeon]